MALIFLKIRWPFREIFEALGDIKESIENNPSRKWELFPLADDLCSAMIGGEGIDGDALNEIGESVRHDLKENFFN